MATKGITIADETTLQRVEALKLQLGIISSAEVLRQGLKKLEDEDNAR